MLANHSDIESTIECLASEEELTGVVKEVMVVEP